MSDSYEDLVKENIMYGGELHDLPIDLEFVFNDDRVYVYGTDKETGDYIGDDEDGLLGEIDMQFLWDRLHDFGGEIAEEINDILPGNDEDEED